MGDWGPERMRVRLQMNLKKKLQRSKDVNNLVKLQIQVCQEEIEQVGKCFKSVLRKFLET